jgi:Flp pilus assembly protein TadD
MSSTGKKSSIHNVFAFLARARPGLILAACLGASMCAYAEACSGPAPLEARLHAHPDAEAYAALGNWFRENEQTDCAAETFQAGLKDYPNSDILTAALVSLNVRQSHFEAASVLAEKLAREKPDDMEAQRIYLRTLINIGDNDAAAVLGRKLLVIAPHDADLLNLNGFLERKAGDFSAARKHLEEAVAVNPNDRNSRVNLGLVLEQLKDAAGAKEQLEKAVELGATEPQVRFELAKVLRTLGENEEAQKQLALYQQKLKEESDQSLAVLKSSEAAQAVKDGDNRKAADLYREARAAQPDNAGLAYRLALVLGDLGDTAGERTALEQAIKADANFALAQYQLGYLDFRAGDNAAAERQFQLTVKAVPDNVQAWISLAAALGAESRFQDARDAVANALKLEPDNSAALQLSKKLAAAQDQQ